jgi:hypothetical protein
MAAYGDNAAFHAIKDGRITCTAPEDAPCRMIPTCECEQWCCCDGSPEDASDNHDLADGGHCCMTAVKSGSCWFIPWIDGADLEDSYLGDALEMRRKDDDGDLTVWPDGPVITEWQGDYLAWEYATAVPA